MKGRRLGFGMSEDDKQIRELEYILAGVMHFVDKWLDGDELENDEVNRAIIAREKALNAIEERDEEIRRLKDTVSAYKLSLDNALFLLKSREKLED